MYSFAQRTDTTVIDEPFYGYYLGVTNANHPGKEEILKTMPLIPEDVLNDIFTKEETPILFLKNMAHHFVDLDLTFMLQFVNIIFIRNPKQIVASYNRVIKNPSISDIGVADQFKIYNYLIAKGNHPLIVNSEDLVTNPKAILEKMCEELRIPFDKSMLKWEAGPRPEDGIWSKYWYTNVHKSIGFQKQKTSNQPIAPHLMPVFNQSISLYNQLNKLALKT